MKTSLRQHGMTTAVALGIPLTAIACLMTEPSLMSVATFSVAAALAVGTGTVAVRAWRVGQADAGQVINDDETRLLTPRHQSSAVRLDPDIDTRSDT